MDLEIAQPGIDALNTMLGWAESVGIREHLAVDLSIARGLDYYTSTIYETFLLDLPALGSVMSGGRYDGLMSMFCRDDVPAVGISLGVDRLLAGLTELGLVDAGTGGPDAYIVGVDDDTAAFAQGVAATLRGQGISAMLHLKSGQNFKKQMKAAEKSGARFAVIAGAREAESGLVGIKELATREQTQETAEAAAIRIKAAIDC